MMRLDNKTILITGGAKRIGACVARLLHNHGTNLIIHYNRSATAAEQLASELNTERESSVSLFQGDLRDITEIRNQARNAIYAGSGLDGLINNASSFFPTPMQSATEDQWQHIMDINVKAPFFLSQALAPYLKKSQGSIVNITDIYADRPLAEHPIYSASKAALVSLTKSLARELGPDVRVNGISPGAILWPENDGDEVSQQRLISSTPLKRIGEPDDIAKAVVFLLQSADFITGQIINVDGGRTTYN